MTDEIFAVASAENCVEPVFFLGLSTLPWIGWTLGTLAGSVCGTNPTEHDTTDLVALLPSGEICYVGWAGRMCYHNCKEGVVRIDYEKYINDEWDYIIHK